MAEIYVDGGCVVGLFSSTDVFGVCSFVAIPYTRYAIGNDFCGICADQYAEETEVLVSAMVYFYGTNMLRVELDEAEGKRIVDWKL